VLARIRPGDPDGARLAAQTAAVLAALGAVLGIAPIAGAIDDSDLGEGYFQAVGVILVLQLLATALGPLLRRLAGPRERPLHEPMPEHERLANDLREVAERLERLEPRPEVLAECERLRRLAASATAR
jgi:hypothetical protein